MSTEMWGERMRVRVFAVMAATVAVMGSVVTGGGVATAAPAACAPAVVSVSDARQYEGSEGGTKNFAFAVTLTQTGADCPASGSVRYRTVDGTAVAGQDYTATTATLSWTGEGARVVSVPVTRDDQYEQDERFTVELSSARGLTIGDGTAVANVLNDDASVLGGGVVVAIPAGGICWWPSEQCRIQLQLNTIAMAPVSVYLSTVDGTAVAGKGYVAIRKRFVTIPTGSNHVDVPVDLLAGAVAGDHFYAEISTTTAGTIGVSREKLTIQAG
jgi:Calx-beta domain-containing protein